MPIKLIATDLDGTLLNENYGIPPRTRAAIAEAARRGIIFTIASGRMYRSAEKYARQLELPEVPLITYNGAWVRRFPDGETISYRPVPLTEALSIADLCEERGWYLQVYLNDQCYVPEYNERARLYERISGKPVQAAGAISKFLKEPPTKVLISADEAVIPEITAAVRSLVDDRLFLASSFPFFLEGTDRRATKGQALADVAAQLGIHRSEILALGDSFNDIDMLEYAGCGVAVAHARDEVKAGADYICQEPGAEGVAEAIEKLVLAGYPD